MPPAVPGRAEAAAAGRAAALRLQLECLAGLKFADLSLDRLRFYLTARARRSRVLYEVALQPHDPGRPRGPDEAPAATGPICARARASASRQVGFERDEGLLPYPRQSFLGYRLLTEFFAFPSKFLFVDLARPGRGLPGGLPEEARGDPLPGPGARRSWSRTSTPSTFRLGCTPVDQPVRADGRADRADAGPAPSTGSSPTWRIPHGMEVYSVDAVTGVDPISRDDDRVPAVLLVPARRRRTTTRRRSGTPSRRPSLRDGRPGDRGLPEPGRPGFRPAAARPSRRWWCGRPAPTATCRRPPAGRRPARASSWRPRRRWRGSAACGPRRRRSGRRSGGAVLAADLAPLPQPPLALRHGRGPRAPCRRSSGSTTSPTPSWTGRPRWSIRQLIDGITSVTSRRVVGRLAGARAAASAAAPRSRSSSTRRSTSAPGSTCSPACSSGSWRCTRPINSFTQLVATTKQRRPRSGPGLRGRGSTR